MIDICKEDMIRTLHSWGCYFIEEIEEELGRELDSDDCRRILLYCLGYCSDSDSMIQALY